MRAVIYRLTLREPLLATSLQGDPNSSVSLSYVPGSLVRGALIQHYIREKKLHDSLLENADAQRLFIDGSTRYLHAYPVTNQDQRSLPTPRSLLRRKHDELDANDQNASIDLLDASHPECDPGARTRFEQSDTLKPLGAPFCASSGSETLYSYRPERTIAVHIQRDVGKGRSLRGNGQVFRYDALAPEQQFQGVVIVENDNDAAQIKTLLEELDTCWLGRSRSAQYGKTSISAVAIEDKWRECDQDDANVRELAAGREHLHSITFLSDALMRAPDGQPVSVLDNATLAAYLGLDPDKDAVTIDDEHSFSATTEISGFNRYWKLPLAQEYALAAGSVISFYLKEQLSAREIGAVEWQGIGARRAEGFGRIAFNWRDALERKARKGTIAHDTPAASSPVLSEHAKALAKRMARQLYTRNVEQSIIEFVKNNPVSQVPQHSQLGRLRMLVRQALPTADTEFVRARFTEFKPTARSQYERARLGGEAFDTWITNLLSKPGNVWTELNNFQSQEIAEQAAERNDQQVALQLLAAVLAAPTRDERVREEQR